MNQQSLFSSGVELAELLLNSGLVISSWDAILDTQLHSYHPNNNDPTNLSCVVKYKVHQSPFGTIIAFVGTMNNHQAKGSELVSSQLLQDSFNLFDFVATKVNPTFSIHRAAVTIFSSLLDELTHLRNQQCGNPNPLIITGHCLGGSIASLFTLWLLHTIPSTRSKRPLCITFGSPLLGDKCFQRAISERPMWNSSFLHVVSNKDFVPRLFIPHTNDGSSSQASAYNPFGTFLLCSELGCACFEEPESISELLIATGSSSVGDSSFQQNILQFTDYSPILEGLMRHSLCRRVFSVDNLMTNLQAGIMGQLIGIGIGMQGHGGDLNSLTTSTAEREKNLRFRKRNAFDPNKKLTERKIDLTYVEWYKKSSNNQGGYYDGYKNKQPSQTNNNREQIKTRQEIIKRHRILTQYWKRMVSEADKMPQEEGGNFRTRWLYGGTNYRRLVEPLDIADYYKKGQKNYTTHGRSQHYALLEKWFNDAKPVVVEGANERNKACSLTEDSCFWAHVEEAIISCKVMKNVESSEEMRRISRDDLIEFERYVMDLIDKLSVSSEIFLPGSSFMHWWEEYFSILGNADNSRLVDFMKEDYKKYA